MSYLILWITGLAAGVLVVALTTALAAWGRRSWTQRLGPGIVFLALLVWGAGVTAFGGLLFFRGLRPAWLLSYALGLTLAYAFGAGLVLRRGLAREGQAPAARRWPRGRLAAALGLVLAVNLGVYSFLDLNRRVDLASLRAEAAAKALNVLPARLPESRNAAGLYEAAGRALGPPQELPTWFRESSAPDFDPGSAEAGVFLEEKKEAAALVREAAAAPGSYEEIEVTRLLDSPLPAYLKFPNLARLLTLAARAKALAGDLAGARADLAAVERLAEHLRSSPTLIAVMVSLRVEEIWIQGLEDVLARAPSPPPGLLDQPLRPRPALRPQYLRALRLEEATMLEALATVDSYAEAGELIFGADLPGPLNYFGLSFWRVFLFPSDLDSARRLWAERRAEAVRPYFEAVRDSKPSKKRERVGVLTSLAFGQGTFKPYLIRVERTEALRGLADLALAATAFQAACGEYPSRLEDLVPEYITEIPTDPFAGQALKMKVLESGLDLFSKGPRPEDVPASASELEGPVHFYLGQGAYQEQRVEPARRERQTRAEKKK